MDLLADESFMALLKTTSAAPLLAAVQLFPIVIFDTSYYIIYLEYKLSCRAFFFHAFTI